MNTAEHHLLVVDDEPDLRTLYELTLLREGYHVDTAATLNEALECLQAQRYSAVLTDMRLPDGSGLGLLRWLEESGRAEKAVVITAFGSSANAVEALKAGAFDYLSKPVDLKQFRSVVASALGLLGGAVRAPSRMGRSQGPARRQMAGCSEAMQQVRALVSKVARSMAPVLIRGESGTGKELVARSIHEQSSRSDRPFLAVNCGAIPEPLLEAEFFGFRKGAFTGAHEDRDGFFRAADGGTLFLDEIGDLPLAMQSKLLRVIQERAVRPVGATAELPVNVRLLSATHKDLAAEVQAGRFRQDLYYRLNVIQIVVPPLRDRREDLPDLARHLLARISAEAGVDPVPRIAPEAVQALSAYSFPGNVRELENLLHRALALSGGEDISPEALGLLQLLPEPEARAEGETPPPTGPLDAWRQAEPLDRADFQTGGSADTPADTPAEAWPGPEPAGLPLPQVLPSDLAAYLDAVERAVLLRALEQHRHNRTAAGASLGLTLRQIRYRMSRLGIQIGGEAGD